MTAPRPIYPGYVEVSTRCFSRRMSLTPTFDINNLILYVFGLAAERFDIRLLCLCTMSNHYHLLLHDPRAELPQFMAMANGLIARALAQRHGHDDKIWSGRPYHDLRPQSETDLLARYQYILANPSRAGLVQRNHDHPGVWTGPNLIGRTLSVRRPGWFFSESMPDEIAVTFEAPLEVVDGDLAGFRATVASLVRDAEREHRRARNREGWSVVGAKRLRSMAWDDRPSTRTERRVCVPHVAARDAELRARARREREEFVNAYRDAWQRWSEGYTETQFPYGSYWMPRYAHAKCQGPAP